jgi:hypothetical protein
VGTVIAEKEFTLVAEGIPTGANLYMMRNKYPKDTKLNEMCEWIREKYFKVLYICVPK